MSGQHTIHGVGSKKASFLARLSFLLVKLLFRVDDRFFQIQISQRRLRLHPSSPQSEEVGCILQLDQSGLARQS